MSYNKINWQNNVTPINEDNLNHMDDQIAANEAAIAGKADSSSVYTKSETYTKTETDGLLSSKLSSGSDRIIQDVTSAPQTENTALLCREGEDIKLYKNGSLCPSDGDSAQEFLSPMLCAYSTEAELSAAIEAHGLTDTTQSGTAAIHLFDLYKQDGTLADKLYIIRLRSGRETPRTFTVILRARDIRIQSLKMYLRSPSSQ